MHTRSHCKAQVTRRLAYVPDSLVLRAAPCAPNDHRASLRQHVATVRQDEAVGAVAAMRVLPRAAAWGTWNQMSNALDEAVGTVPAMRIWPDAAACARISFWRGS